MRVRQVSDTTLLAIYLAIRATRRGFNQVVITNEALKYYLHKEKVHGPRIKSFAESLEPIFPRHSIVKEGYGLKNRLILYLNKEDNPSLESKRLRFDRVPDQSTVDKFLMVQLIDAQTKGVPGEKT